jgi:dipeptidyl-peptidase-4
MKRLQFASILACMTVTGLAAVARSATPPPALTFAAVFDDATSGRKADHLVWAPDGRRLAYAWDDGSGEALWLLDVRTNKTRKLFALGEHKWGKKATFAWPTQPSGKGYSWSRDGQALLLQLDGDLFAYSLSTSRLERLTDTPARESDPAFAPDGHAVTFVRDSDLHILDLATHTERALTTGGNGDTARNAIPDWVYWEEIWGRESHGHWWNPRGGSIAYVHFDDSAVGRYPLSDLETPYPEVKWQRYPTAGTANPTVTVGVLKLADGSTTWMETGSGPDVYIARVDWAPDGGALYVQRLNRDQTKLELLRCRPDTGACDTLLSETHDTWVNLSDDYRFLQDGRIIWPSERSGWKQLELYRPDGTLVRQLTHAAGAVDKLDSVDEKAGVLLFTAYGEPPLGAARRQVYSVPLEGGQATPLAVAPGWNTALAGDAWRGYWVHQWSDANHPPRLEICDASGEAVASLPSSKPAIEPEALPQWELLTIPGPAGSTLPARIMKPTSMQPGQRHAVIMYQYGGPASQVVVDKWEGKGRGLWLKRMAQRSFVVFSVDNQASIYFGKSGEDLQYRRFGEVNLAAQLKAVEFLRRQGYVDGSRIGIWGWSGGGANTLYALTHAPGIWRAGVAGAPVSDWHFYDSIWTERYLDTPTVNPDGYRESSAIGAADRLRDSLLIVHGTADDNVHPNNTAAFTAKLIDAGIPFEMAYYPEQKHHFHTADSRQFYERMSEFFERTLAPGSEPR